MIDFTDFIVPVFFIVLCLVGIMVALWTCAGFLNQIVKLLSNGALQGPQGLKGDRGSDSKPVEHPVLTATGARKDLARVMKNDRGQLVHHGWVQAFSPAHEEAEAKGFTVLVNNEWCQQ